MNSSIPLFIVNLERSADRRVRMQGIFSDTDIPHEFFPAFDGSKEDKAFVASAIKNSIVMNKIRGSLLTKGEVGCAMSHIRLYKKIIDEKIPFACVLEDDIDITDLDAFKKIISFDYCAAQKDWDLLLLGHIQMVDKSDDYLVSFRKKKITDTIQLSKPVQFCYSTTGYVISSRAARILYENGLPVRVPADFLTGDSAKYGIKMRVTVPKVIIPNRHFFENEKSLVSDGSIREKKPSRKFGIKSVLYNILIIFRRAGLFRKNKYYDF